MTLGVSLTTLQRQSWCFLCFSWLFSLGLEGIYSSSTKAALKAKRVRAYGGIATYILFIRKAKKGFSRAPSFHLKWSDQCHMATPPGDLPWPGGQPMSLVSPALAGGFFTTSATWEAFYLSRYRQNYIRKVFYKVKTTPSPSKWHKRTNLFFFLNVTDENNYRKMFDQ